MATILIFPNYLGGGFGHVTRCLALADELVLRGDKVVFALGGPHVKTVMQYGYSIYNLKIPRYRANTSGGSGYIYTPGMNYQIVRDGLDSPFLVKLSIMEILLAIKRIKPDLIVGDGFPLTWMVSKKSGVPVAQVVKAVVHPLGKRVLSDYLDWEYIPSDIISPDPLPVFNPVLKSLRVPFITKAEQLLQGDLYLVPSIPLLDPINKLPENTYYVGDLSRDRINGILPDWMNQLHNEKPLVYVTIGGAAGNVGGIRFFDLVVEALKGKDLQVVVSTGGKISPSEIKNKAENILFYKWVPGPQLIKKCNLVVFHGGYTRFEILKNALPSIVIPFHSEQEYYGRVMEKYGLSKVVPFSNARYRPAQLYWKGGNRLFSNKKFTILIKDQMTITKDVFSQAVDNMLNIDSDVKDNLKRIQQEIKTAGGSKAAVDLIKDKFSLK